MYNKRRTYYEDDDFAISLEELSGQLFVHLAIFKASKRVITKAKEIWQEIQDKCYWLGYEQINTYTTEMRVVSFFKGWERLGEFEKDGKHYEVARWVLKSPLDLSP